MDDSSQFSAALAPLDLLQTFVRAVHASSDPSQAGQTAAKILSEVFRTCVLSLYLADAAQPVLHLLAQVGIPSALSLSYTSKALLYEHLPLLTKASQERAPLLIVDMYDPQENQLATLAAPFVNQETRGCLCLPLWCGETFEGVLIAGFPAPLVTTSSDLSTFVNCGLHLATALASTRMKLRIANGSQYLGGILDQLPEGVIIAEAASGLIRYANPIAAQLLGIAQAELIGSPLQLAIPPIRHLTEQKRPIFFWTFAVIRALGGETLQQIETMVVRPDSTEVPVLCSSAPLRTPQGMINGAILVLQDITLQKHLESHKNAFLALASHELRTPLTTILGYAEVLEGLALSSETEQIDPAFLGIAAHHIAVESEQMAFLIDEMLDLSSLDQDQLILHLDRHDLLEILTQVVETQSQTTQIHQLRLMLDKCTRAGGCFALVDRVRLIQAITNLVKNAIKYSPQGCEIEVGLRQERQPLARAVFWVSDHGLGISSEDLPHLFERFYRSQKQDSSISGLGIGLYLVKQIITRHGGHIWVESIEGHGSTFSVSLPL
jgi:PAS domain S-box-containing protein